jgi:hypothetical protein
MVRPMGDPAENAILVRCSVCGVDLVCWPDRSYPLAPVVEHGNDDTHSFRWLAKPTQNVSSAVAAPGGPGEEA